MTTALITLANYKAYASITSTDTTRDAALQVMIDAATEALRRYASRSTTDGFSSATRTEAYDGNDTEFLELREFPVTSITSITYVANDGTTTTVDSTAYRLEDAQWGIVAKLAAISGRFALTRSYLYGSVMARASVIDRWGVSPNWMEGIQNYSVVYVGGYSTIPAGLQYVLYRWVDQLRGKAATGIMKSERIGEYAYTVADDAQWRSELAELMRPYMRGVP